MAVLFGNKQPEVTTYPAPSVPPHLFETSKPTFLTVHVSPEMALEWLLRNESNRNHRENLVRQYADDMANGRWAFTAEAIQFSTKGRLINGQHRLKAILRSQTTQRMLVAFGIADDAQRVLDSGARRTVADALVFAGFSNGKVTAAIARLIYCESVEGRHIDFVPRKPTTTALLNLVEGDPTIAQAGAEADYRLPKNLATPSSLGYCWWRLHQVDAEANAEFWEKLSSLENMGKGHPILALNKRLIAHRLQGTAARTLTQQSLLITYVFLAWNAWRRDEVRTIIKPTRTDDGRLRAPLPI